jgi:AmmeMemoRadiSam system protein A
LNISAEQKKFLLNLARRVITSHLERLPFAEPCPEDEFYHSKAGCFVSLHLDTKLRGCIGYVFPYKTIYDSVVEMSGAVAFRDPRFSPITIEEFKNVKIEISVLSAMIPIKGPEDIVIGRDGLYLKHPYGTGMLLPQVAMEWDLDTASFLEETSRKAGLPPRLWKDPVARIFRFEAEIFCEP